jgi:hypothetical protein
MTPRRHLPLRVPHSTHCCARVMMSRRRLLPMERTSGMDALTVGRRARVEVVIKKWPVDLRRHLHLAVPKGTRRQQPCSTGERAGPGPALLLRRAPPPRRDAETAAASRFAWLLRPSRAPPWLLQRAVAAAHSQTEVGGV